MRSNLPWIEVHAQSDDPDAREWIRASHVVGISVFGDGSAEVYVRDIGPPASPGEDGAWLRVLDLDAARLALGLPS